MSRNFNKLSAAETERLALLLEELGEAAQIVGKILRHGYESHNPVIGPQHGTNREMLEREMGDVTHAMERLCAAHDLRRREVTSRAVFKRGHVAKYLHHQEEAP